MSHLVIKDKLAIFLYSGMTANNKIAFQTLNFH